MLAENGRMPDALHLLKTRKSIASAFLGEPGPTAAELAEMLTIATRVPDHGKLAPWRFITITGPARQAAADILMPIYRAKNPDAPAAKVEEEEARLTRPPLIVVVVSTAAPHVKIPEWEQVLSAGNAAMSLVFAAHALGYAAHWTTGFIAYEAEARRLVGLTEWERVVAVIHIGTPNAPPIERPRPDLAKVVTAWNPPPTR
jgi:nitroreductase